MHSPQRAPRPFVSHPLDLHPEFAALPLREPPADDLALGRQRLALQALLGVQDMAIVAAALACAPRELQRLGPEAQGSDAARAAVAQWRQTDPQGFDAMLGRAVELLLGSRQAVLAAELALEFGWAALQLQVLERAGWSLLLSPAQALTGRLLKPNLLQPALQQGELLALRLAWTIEALGEPHTVERQLAEAPGLSIGLKATLQARIALAFDQATRAVEAAQTAIDAFPHDLEPPALLARATLGRAWLAAGHPQAALAPLTAALKGARRDDCALLQIEALEALADVHLELDSESGAEAGETARFFSAEAQGLRQTLGLVAGPLPTEHYYAFPQLVAEAQAGLNAGQIEAAARQIEGLSQRESQTFYCYRWRNRLLQAQIHLASLQHQTARLLHWAALNDDAAESDDAAAVTPSPATQLCDFERAWLQGCAALLAARPWPEARLRAWSEAMQARGLRRLAWQQKLLHALSSSPLLGFEGLRDSLQQLTGPRQLEDGLERVRLLAPKLVGPLAALLAQPAIVHHPLARQNARRWLQALRNETPPMSNRTAPAEATTITQASGRAAPSPFGLTPREWQVLCLIGDELSNEQIAAQLFVSLATVKTHINRLYAKLHISSREEALQRARSARR